MARFSFNAKHNHQLITLVKWVRIFVKMFVICWWVSTYVAELFEFKFTLPNNPSKFTRCHRKSGRMCGLLPSMTIFMTAQLSSKINQRPRLLDSWAFGGTCSMVSCAVWEFWDFNRREGSHPAQQEVLTFQSHNLTTLWDHFSLSATVRHWRWFLTLIHVYDHQMYTTLHQMLSTSATKSASWNRLCLHSLALSPTWQKLSVIGSVCEITYQWKKHQNTVFWVDINLALKKRLKFYQTWSNATILHETLPAYCIPKAVRMEILEIKNEKEDASLRHLPKISLKHDWMKELGSEIAQRPDGQVVQQFKSSHLNQPNPNPDHDRTEQPFVGNDLRIAQSGRGTSRSQEIETRSFHEEAVEHDRTEQPVVGRDTHLEPRAHRTRSSDDSKSFNVEDKTAHDRTGAK